MPRHYRLDYTVCTPIGYACPVPYSGTARAFILALVSCGRCTVLVRLVGERHQPQDVNNVA